MKRVKKVKKNYVIQKLWLGTFGIIFSLILFGVMSLTLEVKANAENDEEVTEEAGVEEETEEVSTNEETEEAEEPELSSPNNLKNEGYDIVYVIDNSRSIWSQQAIRNQAFKNITNLAVGSDLKIGVVYFADHLYENWLNLTSMETQEGSKKVLDILDMTEQDSDNRDTNIGIGLEKAIEILEAQNGLRKPIIVLFCDGINENLKGEKTYKDNADDDTKTQVERLKEKDVPIYCVYLQKDRNDEAYLKDLVNYFSDDESNVDERLFKVEDDKINTLSDTFEEVFFSMQNNIKHSSIELDSSGTSNFYVPSFGINQLRVYLDGDRLKGTVKPAGKSGKDVSWQHGTANFVLYEDPAPGEWSIEVTGGDIGEVYGSIAYSANPQLSAELEFMNENGEYKLVIHFYDEEGTKIDIDPNVLVDTTVWFEREDGTSVPIELEMEIKDGRAESNTFLMDGYGTYHYEIGLVYKDTYTKEEMINLTYSVEGGVITKNAPVVTNLQEAKFSAEKTESGLVFWVKESELFYDPEEEEVKVENFQSLKIENPVLDVWQENGYIYVAAEKAGDMEVELQLVDESGMSSKVVLQGEVIDQKAIQMRKLIVLATVGIIFIVIIIRFLNKKKQEDKLEEAWERFKALCLSSEKMITRCESELVQVEKKREEVEFILEGEKNFPGLLDIAESFEREQLEGFDAVQYLENDFCENRLGVSTAQRALKDSKNVIVALKEDAETVKSATGSVGWKFKSVTNFISKIEKVITEIQGQYAELMEQNMNADKIIQSVENKGEELYQMLIKNISCNLTVSNITGLRNAIGMQVAQTVTGKNIQGYYKLDDVRLVGARGTLGENIGKTGIYVYGHENGLCLRSNTGFEYRNLSGSEEFTEKRELVLVKDKQYELRIQTDKGRGCMTVSVK